ncbi:MAG: sugar transferase [Akkermansia sp.]|nr:sugar transferase [Akkermansia sp.]
MTRKHKFYRDSLYPILDLLLAGLFAYISPYVTNLVAPWFGWPQGGFFNFFTTTPFLAGVAIICVPFILQRVGFYHRQNMQRITTAARQLFAFDMYYLCAAAIYLALENYSLFYNGALLVNLVGIPPVLFLRFLTARAWMTRRADAGRYLLKVIVLGAEADVEKGWNATPAAWRSRVQVVGKFSEMRPDTEEEVQKLIEEHGVAAVYVFGGLAAHHQFAPVIMQCEVQGIDVNVVLRKRMGGSLRVSINEVGDAQMIALTTTPDFSWTRLFKSVLDRSVALVILLCTSPLWLLAAVGIKISDPKGPVFFRQRRSGLYGREFRMWKFRSMYVDAEARLDEIKAKYGNEMNGPIFKLTNDPRIFPFGHFIRKTSIDELPQLLNILCGDMSIVGPRPLPVYETAAFPKIEHRRRLSVKPGLTCYWQIEDRSDTTDFDVMVQKDLKYIDNWSLWLDVKLFFRTIPAVLFGKGAK